MPRGTPWRTLGASPRCLWILACAAGAGLAVGCGETSPSGLADAEPADVADPRTVEVEPPPPVMARLTRAQYTNAIHDTLGAGLVVPAALEPDVEQGGFLAVGASAASVSPRGAEQYEAAALQIAAQALAPERRAELVECTPTGIRDDACAGQVLARLGRRLWRRTLSPSELNPLVALSGMAAETRGDFHAGLELGLVALLQSPWFLFRVERGVADETHPGLRRRTGPELATRLAFLLWNTTPDDALLDAAEAGELDTEEGLETHASRLLDAPRAREGLRTYFTEYLGLHELDELRKDPNIFVHMSPQVGPSAREETLLGLEHLVFERDGDWREAFTTPTTFIDRTLAAIYDLPAPEREGFGQVELPAELPRRGLLGQVSFLALRAHPTTSSATVRGKFIRERLLCGVVPTPPANVNTGLPEPSADARTLRERAAVHLEDPNCAGCHLLMDPIGLGLESFDGLGRYRETENGGIINPSGDLDGVAYGDAAELAQVMASHPDLGPCFVRHLYRYAAGRLETAGESEQLDALAAFFAQEGHRVLPLLREVILSPGFRLMAPPELAEAP